MNASGLLISHVSGEIFVGGPVMLGLISGVAEIGTTVTATFNDEPAAGTILWFLDGTAIPGATSASLVVPSQDGGVLRVSVNGRVSADVTIRYAAPIVIASLPAQILTQNTGIQSLNTAPAFSFAGTPVYDLSGAPAGVTVAPASGQVSFDTDVLAAQSATAITVRLLDGNAPSRFAETGFTLSLADTTGPSLTAPVVTLLGADGYSATVSTNEAGGTLYYRITQSASAGAVGVKAGSSQPVTSAGLQTITGTGLAPATTYWLHVLHEDSAGNDSAVASSPSFTTGSAANIPDAFGASDWSVADLASGGDARITVIALPGDGGSALTGIDYRLDGGSWTTLSGPVSGSTDLTDLFTDGVASTVALRAVNAVGAGPESDTKTVTTSSPGSWSVSDNGDGSFAVLAAPAATAAPSITDNGDGTFAVAA